MLDKFWEAFGGRLADQWSTRVLSPALVFWAGGLAAWAWSSGWRQVLRDWNHTLEGLPSAGQVGVLLAALLLVAGSAVLAERLTMPVLRLLEGYWPDRLAEPLLNRRRKRLADARDRAQRLARSAESPRSRRELARLEAFLRRHPDPAEILPTRLGNTLRLAERRPRERHGLDAVVCWPYLWLVLDQDTRQQVATARAALDSAARTWLWAVLFAVWTPWAWWALPIAAIGAVGAYHLLALSAGQTFGTLLEATYTLNRHKLYLAMHWPVPADPEEERRKGDELTVFLWRGIAPDGLRYADTPGTG